MKKLSLTKQIAKIISPSSYCMSPSAYGLKTEKELREKTLAGAEQIIAENKARKIIRLIKNAQS